MSLTPAVNNNDHTQGNANAPLVLVEYGDYQCPYCGAAYPVVKQLQQYFGDKLLFVFRNMPLVQVHQYAEMSAEAAESANAQGQFWPMHDALYENQKHFSPQLFVSLAQKLGLDVQKFEQDLNSHAYLERLKSDYISGDNSGVQGTPTFFINGKIYGGVPDFDSLKAALEALL